MIWPRMVVHSALLRAQRVLLIDTLRYLQETIYYKHWSCICFRRAYTESEWISLLSVHPRSCQRILPPNPRLKWPSLSTVAQSVNPSIIPSWKSVNTSDTTTNSSSPRNPFPNCTTSAVIANRGPKMAEFRLVASGTILREENYRPYSIGLTDPM